MKSKITESTKDDIRFIEMDNKFATTRINICKSLNMVVIHKTFKTYGNSHHLQITIDEFKEIQNIKL